MRPLAVFLNGDGITEPGPRGQKIVDESFLLLFNPGYEDVPVTLPDGPYAKPWRPVLNTVAEASLARARRQWRPDAGMMLSRSVAVLRRA